MAGGGQGRKDSWRQLLWGARGGLRGWAGIFFFSIKIKEKGQGVPSFGVARQGKAHCCLPACLSVTTGLLEGFFLH